MEKTTLHSGKPKNKLLFEILTSLQLLFFAHSFISTYIQLQSLKNMLTFYTNHIDSVAWFLVAIEATIALFLFIPRTRIVGFAFSLLFSLTMIMVMFTWIHYPHDFGGVFNYITENQKWLLLFCLAISSFASVIWKIHKKNTN